jgi:hypothetical protein
MNPASGWRRFRSLESKPHLHDEVLTTSFTCQCVLLYAHTPYLSLLTQHARWKMHSTWLAGLT